MASAVNRAASNGWPSLERRFGRQVAVACNVATLVCVAGDHTIQVDQEKSGCRQGAMVGAGEKLYAAEIFAQDS